MTQFQETATAGSAATSPMITDHHTQHSEDASPPDAGQAQEHLSSNDELLGPEFDGHTRSDPRHGHAVMGDGRSHTSCANHSAQADIIAQLIQLTRMRRRWHKAEKSLTLQGKAMARAWFGGDKDEANKAFALVEKGEPSDLALSMAVTPFLMAREPFEIERKAIEKTMRKLARQLPVWQWVEGIKGLGDLRLAILVGECGDIGSYKSASAVWKRMGLAVIDGGRQRRVSGDDALALGYNPGRRAVAYVMGTEILKAQVRNVKDDDGKRTDESRAIGPYGEIYLTRKAYEAGRDGITKSHANNRAARYMVKRVLRNLYGAWRSAA